jgi:hypothetical protein
MSELIVANKRKVVCLYQGGRVEAFITPEIRNRFTYLIKTVRIQDASHLELTDFAEALRITARETGKIVGKAPKSSGVKIDPDEPMQIPGKDWTVKLRAFPQDSRWIVTFTKFAKTGAVRAQVPQFTFSNDLASAMQLATVVDQTARLMKDYQYG